MLLCKTWSQCFWDKSGIEIRNAKIKHCGMCLPCLYRRVALDTIGLDNEALLGTDVLHDIKFNLDNKHQKGIGILTLFCIS